MRLQPYREQTRILAAGHLFGHQNASPLALSRSLLYVLSGLYNARMSENDMPDKKRQAENLRPGAAAPTAKGKPAPKGKSRQPGALRQAEPDPARIGRIFQRLEAANPHPRSELEHGNAFTLLVAVVLSAQATDVGVNKATRALFAVADTPAKMVALGEEKLRDMIKTIGLYRNKAKNLIALSERLCKEHGGEVPQTREALEALPGVGRKTANVVLNTAFGWPVIAVDTHIFRVSNRIPLAIGKTPLEVEHGLEKIIPPAFLRHAHHWLVLHGRYICKARRPECRRCPIADLCQWPGKEL
jgi:endonuclease-3